MQTNVKRTVYVLGNPLVHMDSVPVFLLPELKKTFPDITFIHIDPTEGFPDNPLASITIIDTVMGIDNVTVFTDLEAFTRSPRMTVHDFDLPLELGMMKKLGRLKEITIIGIPSNGNPWQIIKDLKKTFFRRRDKHRGPKKL